MLHMVLCCGLPIVILSFLPLISRFSQSTGSVIARIVPFICPNKTGTFAIVKDDIVLGIIDVVDDLKAADAQGIRDKYLK